METKQEILDKYIPCQCWPAKDGGKVYNVSCPQHSQDPETAMDEWAEIKAIQFAEWIRESDFKVDGYGVWYEQPLYLYEGKYGLCIAKNTADLYKKFLQSIQQP